MLANSTTSLPVSSSSGTFPARPDTTCRGAPSPTSISSMYSVAAPAAGFADSTLPTQNRHLERSVPAEAAAFCFVSAAFFAAASSAAFAFASSSSAPSFTFSKSTSPVAVCVPGVRWSRVGRSSRIGRGGVPRREKTVAAAPTSTGARKWHAA